MSPTPQGDYGPLEGINDYPAGGRNSFPPTGNDPKRGKQQSGIRAQQNHDALTLARMPGLEDRMVSQTHRRGERNSDARPCQTTPKGSRTDPSIMSESCYPPNPSVVRNVVSSRLISSFHGMSHSLPTGCAIKENRRRGRLAIASSRLGHKGPPCWQASRRAATPLHYTRLFHHVLAKKASAPELGYQHAP